MGIGLATPATCLAGLWIERRRFAVRLVLVASLLLLASTTEIGPIHPFALVYSLVPGAGAIRVVSTVCLVMLIPAAIGLALACERLIEERRFWAIPVIALACFFEQGATTPAFDVQRIRADEARIAAQLDRDCGAFLYRHWNGNSNGPGYQVMAMWVALGSGIPTLNGYSGCAPPDWPFTAFFDPKKETDSQIRSRVARWLVQATPPGAPAPSKICIVSGRANNSQCVADSVPLEMIAGQSYPIVIQMKNTGSKPWRENRGYALELRADDDSKWEPDYLAVPSTILPDEELSLRFNVIAPSVPGTYPMSWRMLQEDVEWFGCQTPTRWIRVHRP
jgi:hypothetical protein